MSSGKDSLGIVSKAGFSLTYVSEMAGKLDTVRSDSPELLDELVGKVLGALDGGVGSSAESGVDLGSSVHNIANDWLSFADPGCNALTKSARWQKTTVDSQHRKHPLLA